MILCIKASEVSRHQELAKCHIIILYIVFVQVHSFPCVAVLSFAPM